MAQEQLIPQCFPSCSADFPWQRHGAMKPVGAQEATAPGHTGRTEVLDDQVRWPSDRAVAGQDLFSSRAHSSTSPILDHGRGTMSQVRQAVVQPYRMVFTLSLTMAAHKDLAALF